jgi:tRNA (pseudouridine54-N1)-methyltransferase
VKRRFVIIGQKASASGDFLLDDVPGTSGRLDVLLRCMRAAMLFSHGIRRDVVVYLVLLGGERAPRVLRVDSAVARFVRPDDRSLAMLAKKALTRCGQEAAGEFVEMRAGISVMRGGLRDVIADLGPGTRYMLDEGAVDDVRDVAGFAHDGAAFFLGDHIGFDDATRAELEALGARAIRVGPVSVHAEDAIAIVSNEMDRREAPS